MHTKHFTLSTAEEAADYVVSLGQSGAPRRVLLIASPGAGATMLARRVTAQLGPLDGAEWLEAAWIRYGSRLYDEAEDCFAVQRPFRAPHHTCSRAAIFGGGSPGMQRPGELSLAHGGVLYLDELLDFRRFIVDDLLRSVQPRLDGTAVPGTPRVLIGRVTPCQCGYLDHPKRVCVCTGERIQRHRLRIDTLTEHFDHVVTLRVTDMADLAPLAALPLAV